MPDPLSLYARPLAAPPVASPAALQPFHFASSARTAGARAAASNAADPASRRAVASNDGRNLEGLQQVMQSMGPSTLAIIERAERGDFWFDDAAAPAVTTPRPSVLHRVYEWCGDTVRHVVGGSSNADSPASRGERAGARESRSVSLEDLLGQVGRRAPQRSSGPRERPGSVSLEDVLRQFDRGHPAYRSSGTRERRGGGLSDAVAKADANVPRRTRP
jgi:hypothetical protein